jgi:hypothetical protein
MRLVRCVAMTASSPYYRRKRWTSCQMSWTGRSWAVDARRDGSVMITERDIWLAAKAMIARYGSNAGRAGAN